MSAAPTEWKAIDEFLFARALEHDSPRLLFNTACEFLRASRIMRPGVLHLLEHVATARDRADDETWDRVSSILSSEQRRVLDSEGEFVALRRETIHEVLRLTNDETPAAESEERPDPGCR